eukprot:780520-Pleurochrysis_carterae.AAC.1
MSEVQDRATDPLSARPSWDASQVTIRPWLEDLQPWLSTCNPSYTPSIENGYVITSQGRVVVVFMEHAESVFFRLETTYTFDSPSPISPSPNLSQPPRQVPPARPPDQRRVQVRERRALCSRLSHCPSQLLPEFSRMLNPRGSSYHQSSLTTSTGNLLTVIHLDASRFDCLGTL